MKAAGRPKKQPISKLRSLGDRGFGLTDKQERFAVIYATHGVTATHPTASKAESHAQQSRVPVHVWAVVHGPRSADDSAHQPASQPLAGAVARGGRSAGL